MAAAALGWHVDVARMLLARVTPRPKYLVVHHELMPFSKEEFDSQRDWEIINTVLRTPEVEPITKAIVEREAAGTYRTHDSREYRVERAQNGTVRFTARDGSTSEFAPVG